MLLVVSLEPKHTFLIGRTPDSRMAPNVPVCILLFLEAHADKDKMAGPKANLISFFVRRIGRVLPIYYAIHFAVLLATSQAWTADFQERIGMELGNGGQPVASVPPGDLGTTQMVSERLFIC